MEMDIPPLVQKIVQQNAKVIWFCGLSGAGKTTLANTLCARLLKRGHLTQVLDGDLLRQGINRDLGFSDQDRLENNRRTAGMAAILASAGVVTIVSLISPFKEGREMARKIIGPENFLEVFINAPLEVVVARDTKGLYKLAAEGKLSGLTGVDSLFEEPGNPDLVLNTHESDIDSCTQKLIDFIMPRISTAVL